MSSAALSIGSLYSHVLGVVFSFCNMHELAMACAVNQGWRNAIGIVPSLLAPASLNSGATAEVMCNSNLARHVGSLVQQYISNRTTIDRAELTLMSQRMQLHRLSFNLSLARQGELVWPRKLRELTIRFCAPASADDLNSALDALGHLPVLTSLSMAFHVSINGVRFTALSTIESLRKLGIRLMQMNPDFARYSLADHVDSMQIADLRLLTKIHSIHVPYELLPALLAAPVPFPELAELSDGRMLSPQISAALLSVRSLTSLHIGLSPIVEYLAFLPQLPLLRSLLIHGAAADEEIPPMLQILEQCTGLTSLTFDDTPALTSSDLAELLSHLVHLQHLSIINTVHSLESLAFLDVGRSPHLAKGLVQLELDRCRGLSNEGFERYLQPLLALKSLLIHNSFWRLSPSEIQALQPPSALLPALTSFDYRD